MTALVLSHIKGCSLPALVAGAGHNHSAYYFDHALPSTVNGITVSSSTSHNHWRIWAVGSAAVTVITFTLHNHVLILLLNPILSHVGRGSFHPVSRVWHDID